ncbi:MAG: NUDIX hydrolase [Acidobacteriota bacterium]
MPGHVHFKHPVSSFTYCPRCAVPLALESHSHRVRKVCPACRFVDFHNPAPAAGAVVVEDGKLLLVRRAHDPFKGDWCFPAGFVEWDESPRECAEREVREETGLEIAAKEIFNVYSGSDDPRTNAILVLYFAEVTGGNPVAGDDASEIRFFGAGEIPQEIAFEAHRRAIRDLRERYPRSLK